LLEWLEEANGEVEPVKLVRGEGGVHHLVAAQDLEQGSLLVRVPFSRRFGGNQLPPEARKAVEAMSTEELPEADKKFFEMHREEMITALSLLVERNRQKASRHRAWLETLPPPGNLRSGLNFSDVEFECLSPDMQVHIHTLRGGVATLQHVAAAACSTGVLQKMCPSGGFTEEEVGFAAVYTLQRAKVIRPNPREAEEELTLFPVVDLLTPTPEGQVVPAGLFYDKETKRTTAATFTVTRSVQKGERLSWSLQGVGSIFHAVGLYGEMHKEVDGWPLRLTWARLSEAAQQRLVAARCGDHANILLPKNGSFPQRLMECLRVAAAFQQRGDDAADLDLSTAESTPIDLQLAAYDLLGGILTTEEKKIPNNETCSGQPGSMLEALDSMHRSAVEILKAADDVLRTEAEALLATLDREEPEFDPPKGGTEHGEL